MMCPSGQKKAYLRVPKGMPDVVMANITEALGRWEQAGRPELPPAPGGRTRHLGGSLDGDQERRLMEAGDGHASLGATRLILWARGEG